jgi:hypothetical protein
LHERGEIDLAECNTSGMFVTVKKGGAESVRLSGGKERKLMVVVESASTTTTPSTRRLLRRTEVTASREKLSFRVSSPSNPSV